MSKDYAEIDLARFIDHSLLNPTATPEQVDQWCAEGDRFGFATVCVYPSYVRQAADRLSRSPTKVCTVIGFPSGANTSATKLYEAREAVENGAEELDVVINLGWLKIGKTNELHRELAEICEETGQVVKAVLETGLLTDPEKKLAAEICMDAGVRFLKTNTGWYGSANVADVRLLKELTKDQVGIKASGGIHTAEQAIELILAGATRLGTSRGATILRQRDKVEEGETEHTR